MPQYISTFQFLVFKLQNVRKALAFTYFYRFSYKIRVYVTSTFKTISTYGSFVVFRAVKAKKKTIKIYFILSYKVKH